MADPTDDNFSGSTGDPEKDMDGREALVEACLDRLFAAFDSGVVDGIVEPVVLLVDCEDSVGTPIARTWEGDDAVDAAIMANANDAEREERNELATTILIRTVSLIDSPRDLPKLFHYLQDSFSHGPSVGGFYVVVISFGGAGVFTVPMTARPE